MPAPKNSDKVNAGLRIPLRSTLSTSPHADYSLSQFPYIYNYHSRPNKKTFIYVWQYAIILG
jgi:hypothetical protein